MTFKKQLFTFIVFVMLLWAVELGVQYTLDRTNNQLAVAVETYGMYGASITKLQLTVHEQLAPSGVILDGTSVDQAYSELTTLNRTNPLTTSTKKDNNPVPGFNDGVNNIIDIATASISKYGSLQRSPDEVLESLQTAALGTLDDLRTDEDIANHKISKNAEYMSAAVYVSRLIEIVLTAIFASFFSHELGIRIRKLSFASQALRDERFDFRVSDCLAITEDFKDVFDAFNLAMERIQTLIERNKRLTGLVHQHERNFAVTIDHNKKPFFVVQDDTVVYANAAFCQMLKYADTTHVIGIGLEHVIGPEINETSMLFDPDGFQQACQNKVVIHPSITFIAKDKTTIKKDVALTTSSFNCIEAIYGVCDN